MDNSFDGVIACSVSEHLIGEKDVQKMMKLLGEKGVFCLYTLICEEVSKDSNWFYLHIPHCTLWTNCAMSDLYEKNGFIGFAYCLEAQMWCMFRDENQYNKLLSLKNRLIGTWFFSRNFVDYWKKSPYREK